MRADRSTAPSKRHSPGRALFSFYIFQSRTPRSAGGGSASPRPLGSPRSPCRRGRSRAWLLAPRFARGPPLARPSSRHGSTGRLGDRSRNAGRDEGVTPFARHRLLLRGGVEMSSPPAFSSVRISGCWALGPDGGNSSAESLDRLYPAVGSTKPPRKRTTSQCKSEPPLLRTSKRTIYTAGRPPWYNEHGTQSKEAFVIGLGGGSASGKTTVATMIIEALDVPWVVLLSMDSFYKVLTKQQQEQAASNDFNFDHPDAFDFDLIIATLKKLKQGKSVKIPIYDFTTHSRKKEWKTLYGANVIIFEGIMAFADKELLKLLDLKIFVDTDSDIRLVRRLRRDISERGRDIEGVIKQYNKFVKPAFDQYIQPTMRLADIVVPRGSGNTVAIDLIVQHVHSQLEERELSVRGSCAGIWPPWPQPTSATPFLRPSVC
ncbi:uridine-cytidine kinase-like 1 isoform X8 [Buteo buteo]|uniref:uridine-cytidine kinase-like 1 isoform X8 n=1 Tax=Buteo buteo TaxID=30397 RepID=UPI003EBC1B5E